LREDSKPLAQEGRDFETIISETAKCVYQLFAARLKGFEHSSTEYLLENFLRRSAEITLNAEMLHVRLTPKPLDIVLRLSGFLDSIASVPWLEDRRVEFSLERR